MSTEASSNSKFFFLMDPYLKNTASYIASEIGEEVVDSTLYRYGASSIEQIASFDLPEVFSELYAIEADLRTG